MHEEQQSSGSLREEEEMSAAASSALDFLVTLETTDAGVSGQVP